MIINYNITDFKKVADKKYRYTIVKQTCTKVNPYKFEKVEEEIAVYETTFKIEYAELDGEGQRNTLKILIDEDLYFEMIAKADKIEETEEEYIEDLLEYVRMERCYNV